ncbi:MAG: alpha/beta hydrolase [Bacteroidetes bacterium]|nr:alpha/beta hydrolase [Bacteroidota bacterium]MDA1121664.1 alpha/beta hydrolase [Bacteroidota bacterium]
MGAIKIPVIVIQGTVDELVPKENADFAKQMINPQFLEIWMEEGMNHFVPWNRPDLINKAILKHLEYQDSPLISRY